MEIVDRIASSLRLSHPVKFGGEIGQRRGVDTLPERKLLFTRIHHKPACGIQVRTGHMKPSLRTRIPINSVTHSDRNPPSLPMPVQISGCSLHSYPDRHGPQDGSCVHACVTMTTALEEDAGIWTVQEWLDYREVSLTMIDAYVVNRGGWGAVAPAIGYSAAEIGRQPLSASQVAH